jgi:hypothetical protein
LAEVRDAAGHANVSITSAYLHVAVHFGHGPDPIPLALMLG